MAKILYFNSLALDFHMDEASRTFRGREGEDTLPGRSLKKRRKTATMMLWDVSFVGGGGSLSRRTGQWAPLMPALLSLSDILVPCYEISFPFYC